MRRSPLGFGRAAGGGELDAGLFFIALQKDPHRQFAALQRRLRQGDTLNEYILYVGSGLFACPPGPAAPGRLPGRRSVRPEIAAIRFMRPRNVR